MTDGQLPEKPSCCGCAEPDAKARERLLRAAADVFDRKGYAAASVREIVEQAGITKPVLYYHYGSKEGILVAILEEGALYFQRLLQTAAARPGTARERLTALCEDVHFVFKENVPVVRVARATYFGPREGQPAFDFDKYNAALFDALTRIVGEGMEAGELRRAPVDDVVRVMNGMLSLFTDLATTFGKPLDVDDIHRLLNLVFEGLIQTREAK